MAARRYPGSCRGQSGAGDNYREEVVMSGHIRRRGERSWELKFDIGADPVTGKRRIRFHSFKGTKRDAQSELTRLMAGVDAGNYVDPSKATLTEYLDRWERDW